MTFHWDTWRYIPEDRSLHLMSCVIVFFIMIQVYYCWRILIKTSGTLCTVATTAFQSCPQLSYQMNDLKFMKHSPQSLSSVFSSLGQNFFLHTSQNQLMSNLFIIWIVPIFLLLKETCNRITFTLELHKSFYNSFCCPQIVLFSE